MCWKKRKEKNKKKKRMYVLRTWRLLGQEASFVFARDASERGKYARDDHRPSADVRIFGREEFHLCRF